MNKGNYVGRLTRNPDLRFSNSGMAFGSFTLAIDRPHSKDKTDFVPFTCVGKTAENVAKFLKKGSLVSVSNGVIQTSSYEGKDGNKVYKTEIFTHSVQFLDNKSGNTDDKSDYGAGVDDFQAIEDDEDIPF